ncbi:hypothetical protein ACRALDRAFT_2024498 [Sodiomyces alcalophilus JCM 7366]|uniref:uncharacterized protein n=1 Tax=Sodiomyces alcalophilus JCM 7366 TaxID=591952 RepID=UPI0039B40506
MPAKRRSGKSASTSTNKTTTVSKRPSALAKEHGLTGREEAEIHEAFTLFAEPQPGHKHGVIPTSEVRSALIALGIPPSSRAEQAEFISILDPDGEGYARYEDFFAVCALKYHARVDEDEDEEAFAREVEEAFALFRGGRGTGHDYDLGHAEDDEDDYDEDDDDDYDITGKGKEKASTRARARASRDGVITLGDLKRVAAVLKEDVGDDVLRDMILEANAGAGVQAGVAREEFEDVMRRAGVWK